MITLTLRDIVNNRDWKLQTDAESLLIGRNRDAQVCIRDRSVSKNHCRIEKRGSSYRFKDLGSRNGTLINDLRCDSGPIENGDELKVGNFIIHFQTSNAANTPLPASSGELGGEAAAFDQPIGDFDLDDDFDAMMNDATLTDFGSENPVADPTPTPQAGQPPMAQQPPQQQLPPQQQMPPQQPLPQQQQMPPQQPLQPQQQMPPQQPFPPQQMPPTQQVPPQNFPPQQAGGMELQGAPAPAPYDTGKTARYSAKTRKFTSRRKNVSGDNLEDEFLGENEQAMRSPPGKWNTSQIVLFTMFSALLGIALGVFIGRKWNGRSSSGSPQAQTQKTQRPLPPANPPGTTTPPAQAAAPAALDPILEPLLGKRADLGNHETSTRHCMRLFLDSLNRTPSRTELSRYQKLDHEGRWKAIQAQAAAEGSSIPMGNIGAIVQLFLGPDRLLMPKERDKLMLQTSGEKERIVYTIVSSQLYSSSDHSRSRSLLQRARSLLVDLHDKPPAESDTRDISSALQETAANPEEFLSLLIEAQDAAAIGPGTGDTDQWIKDTYLRFLQRPPTEVELGETRDLAGADSWRKIILSLTLKRGYSTY